MTHTTKNLWAMLVVSLMFALAVACSGESLGTDGDSGDGDSPDGDTSDGDEPFDGETQTPDGDYDTEIDAEDDAEQPPQRVLVSAYECLLDVTCEQVMVAAHRGDHAVHPENSLAALRSAAALGVDFVEVDVRETSDAVLVLMHDSTLNRTTDGSGEVTQHSWEDLSALSLNGCETGNDESCRIPTFQDAPRLAHELDIMLYVDQKTRRADLVLEDIQSGPYHERALVRDSANMLLPMQESDPALLVMPYVASEADFLQVREQFPDLKIVEIASPTVKAELTATIRAAGVKVQQDVMAAGDLRALVGDYTGWKAFIEAGVNLLQTDMPAYLVVPVRQYNLGEDFPDSGPGPLDIPAVP